MSFISKVKMEDTESNMHESSSAEEYSNDENNLDLVPEVKTDVVPKMFDHESASVALAKMFILGELPFKLVEGDGFKVFLNAIEPRCQSSRVTLIKACYRLYVDEKAKLKKVLGNVASRISLSMNTWTSTRNVSYACLSAHYIDEDWKLHRKILNFFPIPSDGKETGKLLEWCAVRWGIWNVGTMTIENPGSSDDAVLYLKDQLQRKKCILFGGEFFHVRCSNSILNLIVRDCLNEARTSLARIRDAVKYVRNSSYGAEMFNKCVYMERSTFSGSLCLDDETNWKSTYFMLRSALKHQTAFKLLEEYYDPKFVHALADGAPTIDDWNKARTLLKFLELFHVVSMRLSDSYVTSSTYFHLVSFIQSTLDKLAESSDLNLQSMALKVKESFTRYWGSIEEVNPLLLISLVLDPRFKVECLRTYLTEAYPTENEKVDSLVNWVTDTMKRLFEYYKKIDSTSQPVTPSTKDQLKTNVDRSSEEGNSRKRPYTSLLWEKYREELKITQREFELQRYLDVGREGVENDDILSWWKTNSQNYRILSKIAKDIFSIPISTIDSESACSFGNNALGEFHSSLTPKILEGLICAKNWLQSSPLGPLADETDPDVEEWKQLENLDSVIKDFEPAGAVSYF